MKRAEHPTEKLTGKAQLLCSRVVRYLLEAQTDSLACLLEPCLNSSAHASGP